MKHDSHRELLDDLYSAHGTGPDCDTILGMVRARHAARRQRRKAAAGIALLFALGGIFLSLRGTTPGPSLPLAMHAPQMRHISDDELLDMLDGQAAAIATLPDGSKRLLLLVTARR